MAKIYEHMHAITFARPPPGWEAGDEDLDNEWSLWCHMFGPTLPSNDGESRSTNAQLRRYETELDLLPLDGIAELYEAEYGKPPEKWVMDGIEFVNGAEAMKCEDMMGGGDSEDEDGDMEDEEDYEPKDNLMEL